MAKDLMNNQHNTNPAVDQYLMEGCGRCKLGGTPQCKVHRWTRELILLREIVLETPLTEERKWGVPCYTYNQKNICIVAAFKEYCSISFFKGALLKDPKKLLVKPGENSESGRYFKFTDIAEIEKYRSTIISYIQEAIKIEQEGKEIVYTYELALPVELINRFKNNPELEHAFGSLTPGRQKGYILFFTGAKQSKTIESRIDKYTDAILRGKGMHD